MSPGAGGFDRDDLDTVALDLAEQALAVDAAGAAAAAMRDFASKSADHAAAVDRAIALHIRLLNARDTMRADHDVASTIEWAGTWREPHRLHGIGRRAFLAGAAAASAAGVAAVTSPLGLWPTIAELGADYRTGTGQRLTVAIARGLSVELNTRTALSRDGDDRAYGMRLVAGEIAVDAKRLTRPVVITTGVGNTSTMDGRFTSWLGDDGLCVTCGVGTVAVSASDMTTMKLTAGQQVTVGGNAAPTIAVIDPAVAAAWRRGMLIFNGRPLSSVVREINRYRAGRIVLTNAELGDRSVNAVFQIDRLDRAPEQIATLTQARITNLPARLVLLS